MSWYLLFDTVLPLTIDSVDYWTPPSMFLEPPMSEGVFLTSPVDNDQSRLSRMSGKTNEYAKRQMPSPMVGAIARVRMSRAGWAQGGCEKPVVIGGRSRKTYEVTER